MRRGPTNTCLSRRGWIMWWKSRHHSRFNGLRNWEGLCDWLKRKRIADNETWDENLCDLQLLIVLDNSRVNLPINILFVMLEVNTIRLDVPCISIKFESTTFFTNFPWLMFTSLDAHVVSLQMNKFIASKHHTPLVPIHPTWRLWKWQLNRATPFGDFMCFLHNPQILSNKIRQIVAENCDQILVFHSLRESLIHSWSHTKPTHISHTCIQLRLEFKSTMSTFKPTTLVGGGGEGPLRLISADNIRGEQWSFMNHRCTYRGEDELANY